MIRLTRKYRFSASHRLHSNALADDANRELYGKCDNPYGHGHDYVLEVSLEGPLDEATGRICDLATLDDLVTRYVVRELDHKNLNEDAPEFRQSVPTSENLTLAIKERLEHAWRSGFPGEWPRLNRIRLEETKRNSFEYKR